MSYRFTLPALCLIAPAALAQSTITESFASPFTRVATQEPAGVASVAFDASAHELLKPAFDRGDMVRLEGFALPNSQVDLVLRPVSAMESGATAIVMNPDGVERMAPSAAIFQGHVDGLPSGQSSTVFLSVSRTQLNGYVSIDGELVFVSNGMNESPGRAWVTEASALPSGASNSSWCQSINQMVAPSGPATQLGAAGPDVHIGDFYLELDEEFGDLFSSSQDAIDYATTLITATSEVYRRDLGSVINIPNGYMRLWNTTPPWGVTSSFGGLDPFVDWWNSSANPDIDLPRAGQAHRLGHVVRGQPTRQHPRLGPVFARLQQPPVKGQPVAAGQIRPLGRFRVDQQLVRHRGIGIDLSQIRRIRHANGLHHRQAVARAYLRHPLRAFAAMELQHIQRHLAHDCVQHRVIRIDRQRHLGNARRHLQRQRPCGINVDIARTFGKEHKPHIARTRRSRRRDILRAGQPAEFYT